MRYLLIALAAGVATPATAATGNIFSGEFYTLSNSDFVVLIAFLLFVGVLLYFKVPGMIGSMLDKRAENIRSELEEARQLREEAQTLLASYERKSREVQEQADRIVAQARDSARESADQAKADLQRSIERRVQAAEDQIASAESAAIKRVRDEAARVAVAAAAEVIKDDMGPDAANALIDQSIATVDAKLH